MSLDDLILECMRSCTRCTEEELRYQILKRGHVELAEGDGLLRRLRGLERAGRLRCELLISLGEQA